MFKFDDVSVSQEEIDDPTLDDMPVDEEQHARELSDIEQGFGAMRALDGVLDAHADTVKLEIHEGKALALAVEELCNIRILTDAQRKKLPSFEEFSTDRTQKAVTLEAFEDIKKSAILIYDRIVVLINKILDFLKRYFNSKIRKNRKFEAQAEHNDDTFKKILALPAPERKAFEKAEFVDELMWARLNINGKMPVGFDLLRQVQGHIKQVRTFEYNFALRDKYIITRLENALAAVHKPGDIFKTNIEVAISAIGTPHLTAHAADQGALGEIADGGVLYEEKLRFGNCIYYQIGAKTSMRPENGSFRGGVKVDSHAGSFVTGAIQALSVDEANELNSIMENHYKKNSQWLDTYNKIDSRLREMARSVARKKTQKEYDERSVRRLGVLYETLYMFMGLRSTSDMALSRYDQAVCTSLMEMIDRSIKIPKSE